MPRGTTTERGYGWEHRKQRAALLAAHIDGTPCGYCHQPMYSTQDLDADHSAGKRNGAMADRLAHLSCNRSAGGKAGHDTTPPCPHHTACGSYHSQAW